MIQVTGLTKRFGATLAVDALSFEIPQGQIVGFLGPNGAGKTTTMRLLTGYLPPDSGEARLLGLDLVSSSLDVRRRLGYLPENNPLPDDVEVTDYLHYVARLRGLHSQTDRTERVRRVVRQCSLGGAAGKKISELSKGYRQRVGLAQAIVHDPDVLILDEPTSGLDPNQVREVRDLIASLKSQKTVLLSTHILSEVRNTCDRVLIISRGRIVADGTPETITGSVQNVNKLHVALRGPRVEIEAELGRLPGVRSIAADARGEENAFILESDAATDLREDVFRLASSRAWPILGLQQTRLSLEEVFRTLTETPS